MTEAKFTPGPWTAETEVLIRGSDGPRIGFINCDPGSRTDREARANLRLIAAAPDLLAALKLAHTIIGHPDDDGSKIIAAAIAKAEGGNA